MLIVLLACTCELPAYVLGGGVEWSNGTTSAREDILVTVTDVHTMLAVDDPGIEPVGVNLGWAGPWVEVGFYEPWAARYGVAYVLAGTTDIAREDEEIWIHAEKADGIATFSISGEDDVLRVWLGQVTGGEPTLADLDPGDGTTFDVGDVACTGPGGCGRTDFVDLTVNGAPLPYGGYTKVEDRIAIHGGAETWEDGCDGPGISATVALVGEPWFSKDALWE